MRAVLISLVFLLTTPLQAAEMTVASGAFHDGEHAPADTASGMATLVKSDDGSYALKLSDDFSTTPGPDLVVYLSAATDPNTDAEIKAAAFVSAGKLASPTGGQTMKLPKGFDPAPYNSVVIWCEQFRVLFGAAALK